MVCHLVKDNWKSFRELTIITQQQPSDSSRNELSGPHELMLTKTQINKLRKAMSQGTGSDIKISKTQIRKAVRQGGSLW